jgi:hypothetical protein
MTGTNETIGAKGHGNGQSQSDRSHSGIGQDNGPEMQKVGNDMVKQTSNHHQTKDE